MKTDNKKKFEELYEGVDGMSISSAGRDKLPYVYIGNTYGEITWDGFSEILKKVAPKHKGVFYDLGSGTGKPVFMASLAGFKVSIGVEEIEDLHLTAENTLGRFKTLFKNDLSPDQSIRFICDDFDSIDFSDADVIFMNATCFEYELTPLFLSKFDLLKKDALIITNSLYLTLPNFGLNYLGYFPFTWADVEVFVHEKL